jgi:inositol 1,4,5-triphosphate receptor type 1/inositol 1,4,5-triphosphate receptor type 3
LRTGTIVDKTDPKLNQEEDTFGFANLANLTGGVSPEGSSKEIESIDINRILDFEIFPTLITLFCMTQSLSMETKLLNILTRFYN